METILKFPDKFTYVNVMGSGWWSDRPGNYEKYEALMKAAAPQLKKTLKYFQFNTGGPSDIADKNNDLTKAVFDKYGVKSSLSKIYFNNSLYPDHCLNSNSKTYTSEQWVSGMAEVYGDSLVRHIINGDTVLTYTKLMIGGGFVSPALTWTDAHITDSVSWIRKANTPLKEGYIALQAESQPVDFRRVEILNLVGCMDPAAKNYKAYYIKADNSQCRY
ncbi:MAG: DUF1080 domain-containing protein [Chitinophagaceae bacterium]|nr:DUF1080 domain-containing protein [Chitinophagaceae bacterium]